MQAVKCCSVDGCDNPSKTRGWCNRHYLRWWNHGDPLAPNQRQAVRLPWLLATVDQADTDDCIVWPFGKTFGGYATVEVDGEKRSAHRVACDRAHGPAPTARHEAAHSCGRRSCINPRHLRWATHQENQADRLIHGTTNRGERCGVHKLTEDDVREIRRLWRAGAERWTQRGLAGRFGVKQNTISGIVNRRSWAWLD